MAFVFAACASPLDSDPDGPDAASSGDAGPPAPSAPASSRAPDTRPRGTAPAGVEEEEAALVGPRPVEVAAGWTAGGEVALFDVASGEVLTSAPGASLAGERDLAVDPWGSRLIVFQSDADDEWGEIAAYPIAAGAAGLSLGPRAHEVWIDGRTRVSASPFGTVVFEESYGPRWRLVRSDGQPSASVYGPRPASLWTGVLPDGGFRITALTYGMEGTTADLRVALVEKEGVSPPVIVPLTATPVSSPLGARWVESAGGGHVVDVDAASGDVVISTFAGGGWPPLVPAGLGPGIAGVEQASSLPGGKRIALLLTGAADLAVIGVGAGGAPECAAALDLPGEVEPAGLFFARGLLPVGPARVLVATSSGVFAVSASDDCPPALTVDEGFDGDGLRAPLDLYF